MSTSGWPRRENCLAGEHRTQCARLHCRAHLVPGPSQRAEDWPSRPRPIARRSRAVRQGCGPDLRSLVMARSGFWRPTPLFTRKPWSWALHNAAAMAVPYSGSEDLAIIVEVALGFSPKIRVGPAPPGRSRRLDRPERRPPCARRTCEHDVDDIALHEVVDDPQQLLAPGRLPGVAGVTLLGPIGRVRRDAQRRRGGRSGRDFAGSRGPHTGSRVVAVPAA